MPAPARFTRRTLDQAIGFQGNFDALAQWCAGTVPDCPLGTDPAAVAYLLTLQTPPDGATCALPAR